MIFREKLYYYRQKSIFFCQLEIYFTGNDGFQIMFVCQATFSMLQLKKDKGIDHIIIWKSKGVYSSNIFTQDIVFFHNINLLRYKIGRKFNKDPLVVEQNNYTSKL